MNATKTISKPPRHSASSRRLVVAGGGCMGLSSALQLVQAGFSDVTLVARDFTPATTSDGAGALWRPFGDKSIAASGPLFDRWGHITFQWFIGLLREFGPLVTGIMTVPGFELFDEPEEIPYWARSVMGFRVVPESEKASMGLTHRFCWSYTSLIVDMRVYLPFLQREFLSRGGKIVQGEISSLKTAELRARPHCPVSSLLLSSDLIVNCTGLGAGRLLGDSAVFPVRGQLVYVNLPTLFHFYLYSNASKGEYTYIFPRAGDAVVGGTYDKKDDRPFTGSQQDRKTKAAILERAATFLPEIKEPQTTIIREWSGLRPARDFVRLELEGPERVTLSPPEASGSPWRFTTALNSGSEIPIVHNYGHGGSGMTLHWGCAIDTINLVRRAFALEPLQEEALSSAPQLIHHTPAIRAKL